MHRSRSCRGRSRTARLSRRDGKPRSPLDFASEHAAQVSGGTCGLQGGRPATVPRAGISQSCTPALLIRTLSHTALQAGGLSCWTTAREVPAAVSPPKWNLRQVTRIPVEGCADFLRPSASSMASRELSLAGRGSVERLWSVELLNGRLPVSRARAQSEARPFS